MKTFKFVLENLGPIKSATFSSSHLNVRCGKNNSGKSFLIHAVYCIFQYLNDGIRVSPRKELINGLLANGVAEFSILDYLSNINELIAQSLTKIVLRLPGMMNKSKNAFKNCKVAMTINEDYAREFLLKQPISFRFRPSQKLIIVLTKAADSDYCRITFENGSERLPDSKIITRVLSFALHQIIGRILPSPVLLTAERTGVSACAGDVMSYVLSKRVEQTPYGIDRSATVELLGHYPMAIIQEMVLQNEIKQTREDKKFIMSDISEAKSFYDWFKTSVMDGNVVAREGKLYFVQLSNKLDMPFADASSSVRALAELNYFVHYMMVPGSLLMIDEPELNLHPERQRMLMRALARMANNFGVGIVVSTHSVTMIRELNTLMAFNTLCTNQEELIARHGYCKEELLDEDDVSCGIVENGTIYQEEDKHQRGFFVRSFDDTNDSIAAVQNDIVQNW